MLLLSESGTSAPLPGSSQPLCLGPPIYRLLSTTTFTRENGTFAAVLPTLQGPLAGTFLPGQAWHVQAWFRDPVASVSYDGATTSSTSTSVIVLLK